MGSHFGLGAPLILEPILVVGLNRMFAGGHRNWDFDWPDLQGLSRAQKSQPSADAEGPRVVRLCEIHSNGSKSAVGQVSKLLRLITWLKWGSKLGRDVQNMEHASSWTVDTCWTRDC